MSTLREAVLDVDDQGEHPTVTMRPFTRAFVFIVAYLLIAILGGLLLLAVT